MGRKRRKTTCKEGDDGLLYQIRDDDRSKLLRRDKALKWVRRNAPAAVERVTAAYDRADARAKADRDLLKIAVSLLRDFGWTAEADGTYTRVSRGVTNRTTPKTVAELVGRVGPDAALKKFAEVDRGVIKLALDGDGGER